MNFFLIGLNLPENVFWFVFSALVISGHLPAMMPQDWDMVAMVNTLAGVRMFCVQDLCDIIAFINFLGRNNKRCANINKQTHRHRQTVCEHDVHTYCMYIGTVYPLLVCGTGG